MLEAHFLNNTADVQVAEVCLQAALDPAGSNKVVEVSAQSSTALRLLSDQLAAI